MGKKICKDSEEIHNRSDLKHPKFYCKKCGEKVAKEKWVCKPKKLK